MTPKQKECLDFIRGYILEHGISPCYREIQSYMGLKSSSSVHRIVQALAAHGEIKVIAHRYRSITLPDAETDYDQGFRDGYEAGKESVTRIAEQAKADKIEAERIRDINWAGF